MSFAMRPVCKRSCETASKLSELGGSSIVVSIALDPVLRFGRDEPCRSSRLSSEHDARSSRLAGDVEKRASFDDVQRE